MAGESQATPTTSPDPSVLTTEQLYRALQAERGYTDGQLGIRDERFRGIDRATEVLSDQVNRVPTDLQREITHLRELMDEKFTSVSQQFTERDVRSDQQAGASSQALAAALQAAKELVGAQGEASAAAAVKSETSFTKQIDQIGTIIQTLEKALDARITELKERIDRGEGTTTGARDTRIEYREDQSSNRQGNQWILALVLGFFSIIGFVLAAISFAHQ